MKEPRVQALVGCMYHMLVMQTEKRFLHTTEQTDTEEV